MIGRKHYPWGALPDFVGENPELVFSGETVDADLKCREIQERVTSYVGVGQATYVYKPKARNVFLIKMSKLTHILDFICFFVNVSRG